MAASEHIERPEQLEKTAVTAVFSGERPPEPPVRYDPGSSRGYVPNDPEPPEGDYRSLRRLVVIAQSLALVSLLIGGMVLSVAAAAVAIIGYRKVAANQATRRNEPLWLALKRSAAISIAMAAIALALNAIAMVYLYPILMEALQSGDYQSLFGMAQQAVPADPGSGSSTWG